MGQNSNKSSRNSPQNNQKTIIGNPHDGKLAIWLSQTGLEAFADFIPPAPAGHPLILDDIAPILEKVNINYGIEWEAIKKALQECNLERKSVNNVIIAKGDPPESEMAEYFKRNPALDEKKWQNDDKSRIDHRQRSPFTIVKKDQTLAITVPMKPGKEGKNVHGDVIPYNIIRPESIISGINTRTEDRVILSNINGQLIHVKTMMRVQDTLDIDGSIGYATGNIVFPGDIKINGSVADGFKIYSGGSITIKQTFDVTEAVAKKDLFVYGGIIGKGIGAVKAGGKIRTTFIGNCHAAARDSIFVEKEINNSSVYTLEKLEMADNGIILGSKIYCVHGLKAGGIGRKAGIGKASHIHCGVDFVVQQENEKCKNRLQIMTGKMAKLNDLLNAPDTNPEKKCHTKEFLQQLEEEWTKTNQRVLAMMDNINVDEDAVIEVTGEICKGTIIAICQAALFVSEPMYKTRIRLDKTTGKLVCEPL